MSFEDVGLRATLEDAEKFLRDAQRVNQAMDGLARNAVQTANETRRASTGIFDGFRNGARTVLNAASSFGLAVFGVRELIGAVRDVGGAVLGSSIEFEQMQISLETLTGSTEVAQAQLESLERFARTSPFEFPEIVRANNQLLAFGFAIEDTERILRATSDAAAGLGRESFPSIIRALGQIRARGKLSGEELLQLTEAGIPAWEILSQAIGLSVAELQDLVRKGAIPANEAIDVLVAGMQERFGGLSERQAQSFGGMLSNLSDFAGRATRIFSEDIFAQAREQLGRFIDALDTPETEAFIRSLGATAGDAFGVVIDAFERAADFVGRAAAAFADARPTIDPILETFSDLAGIVGDFVSRAGPSLLSILGQLGEIAIGTNPQFVILSRVLDGLRGNSGAVGSALDTVRSVLDSVASALASLADPASGAMTFFRDFGATVEGVANTLIDIVAPMVEDVAQRIADGIAQIEPLIGPALEAIAARVQDVLTFIEDAWEQHGEGLLLAVRTIFDAIVTVVGTVLENALGTIRAILAVIGGDWETAWTEVKNIFIRTFNAVIDFGERLLGNLVGMIRRRARELGVEDTLFDVRDTWLRIFHDIAEGVAERFNAVATTINGFIDDVNAGLRRLGREPIEFRIAPIDVGPLVLPGRESLFGFDRINDDIDVLNENVAEARQNSRGWFSEWLAGLFKPGDSLRDTRQAAVEVGDEMIDASDAAQRLRDSITAGSGTGQTAVNRLRDTVQDLEADLRAAQDAMRAFADPRLVGMQAAEDELFELDQAIKKARLEELRLGDQAEETASSVEDSFDVLGAQQRELAEGIPVAFQRAQHEAEQARRRAEAAARGPAPAEEGESEVDRLRRIREIRQLEFELEFEPLQRALRERFEELQGLNEEITFEEALRGLEASHLAAQVLAGELSTAKSELDLQEQALQNQKTATTDIATTRAITLGTETEIKSTLDEQLGVLDQSIGKVFGLDQMWTNIKNTIDAANRIAGNLAEPPDTTRLLPGANRALAGLGVLPELAEGGDVTRSGLAVVGERGPELAMLGAGTRVLPHQAVQSAINRVFNQTNTINAGAQAIDVWRVLRDQGRMERIRMGRGGR